MEEDHARIPSVEQTDEPAVSAHVQVARDGNLPPGWLEVWVFGWCGSDDEHFMASRLPTSKRLHDPPEATHGGGLGYMGDTHAAPVV